jgi:glycerol-3-phosphate dehydrogenase (NAD(P)+)
LGSGSWATALAKILTDNGNAIHWWVRNETMVKHILNRHHNPNYLSSVDFDSAQLSISSQLEKVIRESDHLVVAIPSAYIHETFEPLDKKFLRGNPLSLR